MSSGYQQFFKQAQKAADEGRPAPNRRPRSNPRGSFSLSSEMSERERPRTALDDLLEKRTAKKNPRPAQPKTQVENLRARMRDNAKKPKRRPPLMKMLVATVGLLITGVGFYHISDVEKIVKSVEITMLGTAMAEEGPKAPQAPESKTDKAMPGEVQKAPEAVARHEVTDEEVDHFSKLNERQHELDAREAELNRMETELAKQKEELEKRLTQLDSTRRQISSVLEDRVQADDKKVDSLVQVYSNMKPQQAAKVFETMDEDLAIEILGRMKKKPAAEILNLVKAEKAQTLSEKYAGYKRKGE